MPPSSHQDHFTFIHPTFTNTPHVNLHQYPHVVSSLQTTTSRASVFQAQNRQRHTSVPSSVFFSSLLSSLLFLLKEATTNVLDHTDLLPFFQRPETLHQWHAAPPLTASNCSDLCWSRTRASSDLRPNPLHRTAAPHAARVWRAQATAFETTSSPNSVNRRIARRTAS